MRVIKRNSYINVKYSRSNRRGDLDFCGALNFYNRDKSSYRIYHMYVYTNIYIVLAVAHKTSLDIVFYTPSDFLPFLNISPATNS